MRNIFLPAAVRAKELGKPLVVAHYSGRNVQVLVNDVVVLSDGPYHYPVDCARVLGQSIAKERGGFFGGVAEVAFNS
ncbi:MAG TPA: hypothetical protein VEH04_16940 [Verrucomicrobiae bacterium]|nr:hypothetical protein [Verrucomicrobiae bacterium]